MSALALAARFAWAWAWRWLLVGPALTAGVLFAVFVVAGPSPGSTAELLVIDLLTTVLMLASLAAFHRTTKVMADVLGNGPAGSWRPAKGKVFGSWLVLTCMGAVVVVAAASVPGDLERAWPSTLLVVAVAGSTWIISLAEVLRRAPSLLLTPSPPGSVVIGDRLVEQSALRGRLWIGVGAAVLVVGCGATFWTASAGGSVRVAILVACVFSVTAQIAIQRGRRHLVRVGLDADPRPPILFLRPFEQDGVNYFPRPGLTPSSYARALLTIAHGTQYEDALVYAFRDVGPLVAIGRPGDSLPQTGAARVYFDRGDEDGWRSRVKTLVAESRLVILQVGSSPGLAWEVETVLSTLRASPDRLALAVPPPQVRSLRGWRRHRMRHAQYEAFRSRFSVLFPRGLPEALGPFQFLMFAADWTPVFADPDGQSVRPPRDGNPMSALSWLEALLAWR